MPKRTSKSQTSNLIDKLGTPVPSKPVASDKMKSTAAGFQMKFNKMNVSNFVTGGSTSTSPSANYGNQSTINSIAGKKVGAATQIPQLTAPESVETKSGDSLISSLAKMFSFMQQAREEDLKRRDTDRAFIEEKKTEEQKRHEQFLKVLKEYTAVKTITAVAEKTNTGGIFDGLWDTIKSMISSAIKDVVETVKELKNLIKPILEIASKIGKFVGSNLFALLSSSAGLLAVTTIGALASLLFLAKSEKEAIEANPYDPKYKDNPYAMKLRGEATSIGQATVVNQRKTMKQFRRNEVDDFVKSDFSDTELKRELGNDRPTLQKWLKDNPKRDAMYQAPVAAIAGQPQTAIPAGGLPLISPTTATTPNEQAVARIKRQGGGTEIPTAATESTPTAMPVPPTPATSSVNDVIAKNADLIMNEYTSSGSGATQPIVSTSSNSTSSPDRAMSSSATQRDDTAIINRVFDRVRGGV